MRSEKRAKKGVTGGVGDVSPGEVAGVVEGGEFVAVETGRVNSGDPVDYSGRGGHIYEDGGFAEPEGTWTGGGEGGSGGHAG